MDINYNRSNKNIKNILKGIYNMASEDSLYHYCSIDSLKAILEFRTLRLSDITKSNDSDEILFLIKKFNKWSLKCTNNEGDDGKTQLDEKGISKIFDDYTFLVSCLSKKGDDLHMWSSYGRNGACIEFDKRMLNEDIKDVKKLHNGMCQDALKLANVEYCNDVEIIKFLDDFDWKEDINFEKIFQYSPEFKSDYFATEEEVRVIYFDKKDFILDNNYLVSKGKNIEFKSTKGKRSDHTMVIDIPITIETIKSIRLSNECTITQRDLRELFKIYHIKSDNIKVRKTKGTFR